MGKPLVETRDGLVSIVRIDRWIHREPTECAAGFGTLEGAWYAASLLAAKREYWAALGPVTSEAEAIAQWERTRDTISDDERRYARITWPTGPFPAPPSLQRTDWVSEPGWFRERFSPITLEVRRNDERVHLRVFHHRPPTHSAWSYFLRVARRFAASSHPDFRWIGEELVRDILGIVPGELLSRLEAAYANRAATVSEIADCQRALYAWDEHEYARYMPIYKDADDRLRGRSDRDRERKGYW